MDFIVVERSASVTRTSVHGDLSVKTTVLRDGAQPQTELSSILAPAPGLGFSAPSPLVNYDFAGPC